MKRLLHSLSPGSIRYFFRRVFFLPADAFESVTGKRPNGILPRKMILKGNGDFEKRGEKFLDYFKELCILNPGYSVLDVGCGSGMIAFPLIRYLNQEGSYDGFDSVKSDIDWCNKYIAARNPNFRFKYFGLFNESATTIYQLPYGDSTFDFVFVASVLTLLKPTEAELFIPEISRVMKPGATCMLLVFLVNCESEDMMIKRPTKMNFPINKGFYRLQSMNNITANVAYDEEWLLGKLENAGLKLEDIKYGQWCGRMNYLDFQDMVICSKTSIKR